MSKSILVCDDHRLFGNGLREILSSAGYQVTVVSTSSECKDLLKTKTYDVFLCDLNIDSMSGFELFCEMRSYLKSTTCFLLTAYYENQLANKAQKLGFNGYLTKDLDTQQLVSAIDQPSDAPFYNATHTTGNGAFEKNATPATIYLSKQEKNIIKLVVQGNTSKEIAELLKISKTTVDTHRRNIYKKTAIESVAQLIQFAHENNLID